jgi:hypothetical protein
MSIPSPSWATQFGAFRRFRGRVQKMPLGCPRSDALNPTGQDPMRGRFVTELPPDVARQSRLACDNLPLEPGYLPDERVMGERLAEPSLFENRKHL